MGKPVLVVFGLVALLSNVSACGFSGADIHMLTPTSQPDIKPITAPYRPFRTIQVCLDTPPFYPSIDFQQAANKIADWIEADVTVNQGGFVVYVGEITSRSFQSYVIAPIQVKAFPPDEMKPVLQPTYTPQPGENPYHTADV